MATPSTSDWLAETQWGSDGLLPAIAQEAGTGRVLMLAWMNRESLAATLESGYATYYSRSRRKLWRKGETSGHLQEVREIRLDCDGDALLLQVHQAGGVACHTGRPSCFFRQLDGSGWRVTDADQKGGGDE